MIPSPTPLSRVIAEVTAPAFWLGSVATYTAEVPIARMDRIIDRSHVLNRIGDDEPSKAHLKSDSPLLKRRGASLNEAILVFRKQGDYHVRACNPRVRPPHLPDKTRTAPQADRRWAA